ncbi:MAG: EFR1 family ferrodoxin [Muribaculaceae bacterium]|nr:EFR1 family ferrodoxin [Muribaculaceae bacterium]
MIIFFSGTGNSHFVARELGKLLHEEKILQLKGEILYDPTKSHIKTDDKRIIWVFPTYSWGVPPVVKRFIKECNFDSADTAKHFMVTTCGDDTGETAAQWRKLIAERKWTAANAYTVIMPNTYVLMKGFDVDSPELAAQKLKQAPSRIAEIADHINKKALGDMLVKGSWPKIKTGIIYPYFVSCCMSPKPFKTNANCIGCGKCAQACPMDNITMGAKCPQWHDRCALCLRCYHICPCDAVEYGNATKDKGQYFLE